MKKLILFFFALSISIFAQNEIIRKVEFNEAISTKAPLDSITALSNRINQKQNIITNLSDTTKYLERADTTTILSYTKALIDSKIGVIPNLSDTAKYVEITDTNTILSYTKTLISGKQNAITNLADTSKYVETSDTATVLAYTKALINGKQATISNLSDTTKYVERSDTTSVLSYTKSLINAKQNAIANIADTSKYIEMADSSTIWYNRTAVDNKLSTKADSSYVLSLISRTTPTVSYKNYNTNLPRLSPFGGIQDTWGAYWTYPDADNYWLNNDWQLHMLQNHGMITENPKYDSLNLTGSALKCAIGYDVDYTGLASTGTPRCEIYWNKDLQDMANDTLTYTWKTFIPSGTIPDNTGSTLATDIHQVWHAKHLQLYGSKYAMDVQDDGLVYHRDTTSIGSWLGDVGKWVNWKVEMTARSTDDGATFFKLYKNNVLVYQDAYANLRPGDSEAMLKWGLYKSDWHAASSLIDTLSIYIDEITITNETDNIVYYTMDFSDSTAAHYGNTTGDDLRTTVTLNGITIYNTATTYDPTNYYVSLSGSADNSGHHPDSSWTVDKFNSFAFSSGDSVFFKKGDTFTPLTLNDNGVIISSYSTGNKPIIDGSTSKTGWSVYSGNIYVVSQAILPRQVFVDTTRAFQFTSLDSLNANYRWYHSSGSLYLYSSTAPANIRIATTGSGIAITGDSNKVIGLQVQRTYNAGINIASGADYNTIDGCTLYQWTNEANNTMGGIYNAGASTLITNNIFGKNTGSPITDQNWAGFNGVYSIGSNATISYNTFYHTSVEDAPTIAIATLNGSFGATIPNNIRIGVANSRVSGKTWVHHNTLYHPAAFGIVFFAATEPGDTLLAEYNTASYCGQAGICAYQTRAASNGSSGGIGIARWNNVTYSNRLGGSPGMGGDLSLGGTTRGNLSGGIHFNDGSHDTTSTRNPNPPNWNRRYIKWYCYENEVSYSMNPAVRNNPDSDGIPVDYNANNVSVYRNLVHDNDGKGVYVWNADSAHIYSNIIYNNGIGILVASDSVSTTRLIRETSVYNRIEGNTLYNNGNYNSWVDITNVRAEIGFGYRSKNTVIRNNIIFSRDTINSIERFCFRYDSTWQFDANNIVDYNVYYRPGSDLTIMRDAGGTDRTWASWTSTHSTWDTHSYNSNPSFNTTTFKLNPGSPAIGVGTIIYTTKDYYKNPIVGTPDIGATEYVLE